MSDRDADSLVVSHVNDARCGASEVSRQQLFKRDVFRQVQKHGRVVRLGTRLVRMIQHQVHRHVLPTFTTFTFIYNDQH